MFVPNVGYKQFTNKRGRIIMKNTLSSIVRLFIQVAMLFTVLLMLPEKSESITNITKENTPEKTIINTNNESPSYKFPPAKSIFISAQTKLNQNISY